MASGEHNSAGKYNDLHLKYGAHISCHDGTNDSLSPEKSTFLPSFEFRSGLQLPEPDACKIVIEALLGHSNDIFNLSDETNIAQKHFSLSYTARHMYLKGTSAKSLQPLLEWFAALATSMYVCRSFAYQDIHLESSRNSIFMHSDNEGRGDNMTVIEALRATIVDLIASVEDRLCSLDTIASVATKRRANEHTLIALYVSCRSWVPLFKSMSAIVITAMLPPTSASCFPSSSTATTSLSTASAVAAVKDKRIENTLTRCDLQQRLREEEQQQQQERVWQSLQFSGIMQSLFSLQRWRKMSNMRDPSSLSGSYQTSSSRAVFGEKATAKTNDRQTMTINVHNGSIGNFTCSSSSSSSGSSSSGGNQSHMNSTTSFSASDPLDKHFSRHLYGAGLLPPLELQYFLSTLNSQSHTHTHSSSSLKSHRFHGAYSFFVGCTPGNEIGFLYGFRGNDDGCDRMLTFQKDRDLNGIHRIRDCHKNQETNSSTSSSSFSSSSQYPHKEVLSSPHFSNRENRENKGSRVEQAEHLSNTNNAFYSSNFFSNCSILSSSYTDFDSHSITDSNYYPKHDPFDIYCFEPMTESKKGDGGRDEGIVEGRNKNRESGWRVINTTTSQNLTACNSTAHGSHSPCTADLPVPWDVIDWDGKERDRATRSGMLDLMPLSVQMHLSVSLPLKKARASELYASVCTLRSRHGIGRLIKCKYLLLFLSSYSPIFSILLSLSSPLLTLFSLFPVVSLFSLFSISTPHLCLFSILSFMPVFFFYLKSHTSIISILFHPLFILLLLIFFLICMVSSPFLFFSLVSPFHFSLFLFVFTALFLLSPLLTTVIIFSLKPSFSYLSSSFLIFPLLFSSFLFYSHLCLLFSSFLFFPLLFSSILFLSLLFSSSLFVLHLF